MDIKIRLLKLGKKQVDLLRELHAMGFTEIDPSILSAIILNKARNPKSLRVRALCDEILTQWENEQKTAQS